MPKLPSFRIVALSVLASTSSVAGETPAAPAVPTSEGASVLSPSSLEAIFSPPAPGSSLSLHGGLAASAGGPGARADLSDLYRKVAPGVVIVRSANGYGTGVLIDSAVPGLVLTNHHVAADGTREGLKVKVVVETGKMAADGSMETDHSYVGYVAKWDPAIDLAVIKMVDPPPDLPTVPLAPVEREPKVGQEVASVGHGGIGLLWAIKGGNVDGIGKLASRLAEIGGLKCDQRLGHTNTEERCKELENAKNFLDQSRPAVFIQSSCVISPGDSGGPLVNHGGEIVGLNDLVRSAGQVPVTANFHIHVDEIRAFLKDGIPAGEPIILPDPWTEGGPRAVLGDADLDGKIDTLVLSSLRTRAYFFDLAETTVPPAGPIPPVEDMVKNRSFKADAVVLDSGNGTYVWYDSNGSGHFDRLRTLSRENGKVVAYVYGEGGWKEDTATKLIDPDAIGDPARRVRLGRIASFLFPGLATGKPDDVIPDALWSGGRTATVQDLDRDGISDTIVTHSAFGSAFLIDPAQSTLGPVRTPADAQKLLDSRKTGTRVSVVRSLRGVWAFYDQAGTGNLDLVLSMDDDGYVTHSQRLNEGKPSGDPGGDVGRKALRPGLLQGPPGAAKRFAQIAGALFTDRYVASDEGLGSFPSTTPPGLTFELIPAFEGTVIGAERYGRQVILVDPGGFGLKKGKGRTPSVDALAKAGRLKAPLAWIGNGGAEWTFYDTDGDGKFDLVTYAPDFKKGTTTAAYRIDKDGHASPAPDLAAGRIVRWSVFQPKTQLAKKMKPILRRVFDAAGLEP